MQRRKRRACGWGGTIALGYDCVDHRLVVNQVEADTVCGIFRNYLRLGCVRKLKQYLEQKQIRSKVRRSNAGQTHGGTPYSRGALYHLLSNRIYIGEVVHRGQSYPGQHRAIVPRKLWDQVTTRLLENNQAHRTGKSHATPSLLSGKLFDSNGVRFTPTHALKNAKRYRYYTSQTVVQQAGIKPAVTRFPAQQLENLVKSQIHLLLQTPGKCTAGMRGSLSKGAAADRARDLAKQWSKLEISKQHEFIRNILRRVSVGQAMVWIEIDRTKLVATLLGHNPAAVGPLFAGKLNTLKLTSALQVFRRRGELRVIAPHDGDSCFEGTRVPSLVKAVARSYNWYQQIVRGEINTLRQLTQKTGLTQRYVRRILQCANLSPQITEALLTGKHPPHLTLKEILRCGPLNWREQETKILRLP